MIRGQRRGGGASLEALKPFLSLRLPPPRLLFFFFRPHGWWRDSWFSDGIILSHNSASERPKHLRCCSATFISSVFCRSPRKFTIQKKKHAAWIFNFDSDYNTSAHLEQREKVLKWISIFLVIIIIIQYNCVFFVSPKKYNMDDWMVFPGYKKCILFCSYTCVFGVNGQDFTHKSRVVTWTI